ncbi:MAG TPA: M50 family metallopeptidase, partial [Verrucomicrobiota bacterium]|nr:M50 family metallopeptidase [Verrucomicrobiota bacterium]
RSEGARISVKVERNGQVLEFQPEPAREPTKIWQRQSLRQIRILPAMSSIIAVVITNSPAAVAGLRPGDRILSVNGQPLFHFAALGEYVEQHANEALTLEVQRGSARFSVSVRPEKPISPPDEKPRLGIIWNASGDTRLAYPGAVEQVRASVMVMVDTFEALFASKSDIKPQHLGGAVKIMDVYYRLFDSEQGWRLAIWFSVLMNVNLALLNLLPIPVLDGGHILLAIIEGIRRRPISMRLINAIQTTCAVLLIGFMVYLAFYDVQELPWKRSKEKLPELKFAPKPPTAP